MRPYDASKQCARGVEPSRVERIARSLRKCEFEGSVGDQKPQSVQGYASDHFWSSCDFLQCRAKTAKRSLLRMTM